MPTFIFEMIKDAFKQGYYAELENDKELDPVIKEYVKEANKYNTVDSYIDLGTTGYYYDDNEDEVSFDEYLIYMIYVPDDVDEKKFYFSPSSDGYETVFKYANGSIWIRNFVQSFKNNNLFTLLDRIPIRKNLKKECINMRFKLTEGINDVKKYYPNISEEDFNKVIDSDPTSNREKDKAGKYSKWLLNLYKK